MEVIVNQVSECRLNAIGSSLMKETDEVMSFLDWSAMNAQIVSERVYADMVPEFMIPCKEIQIESKLEEEISGLLQSLELH
ncbi:hypothetical protein [Escherichia phage vB_EcoM-LTH01]